MAAAIDICCENITPDGAEEVSNCEQLATHIPDLVIQRSPFARTPETITSYGVVFFGDISGFTALCEKYCNTSVSKKRGTDQLTSTLNSYLSVVVQAILENGGDILKFAGDALLAYWPCHRFDAEKVVQYLTKEMLSIQTSYDNYQTNDGVLLRMKIALSVGKCFVHFIGSESDKTFDFTGPAVDEVNLAQSFTGPGAVVITKTAWEICDQSKCTMTPINGTTDFVRIIEAHCDDSIITHSILLQLLSHNSHTILQHTSSHISHRSAIHIPINTTTCNNNSTNKECTMVGTTGNEFKVPTSHLGTTSNAVTVKERGLQLRKRAKRLLRKLSEEDRTRLKTYVLRTVVQKIGYGYDVTWLSELRQVSVLFINFDPDFSLSTDITARGEKEQLLLQTAFEFVYPPLVKYDGTLNKVFMFDKGCTFLCIFGLPHASHEDDPYRALEAAKEIFIALDNLRLNHYSIGVTTGIAFCGVVGHHERHEYTVIGEKVNMAARLMAKFPDALTCDETTKVKSNLPSDRFVLTPPVKLKGISNLEDMYFVSTENKDELTHTKLDTHAEQRTLIGRVAEMERFLTELRQVSDHCHRRDPGVIIITGPGGIGKSKLLQTMKINANEMGFRVVSGLGGIIEQNTPFYTVKTLLTRLLELDGCTNIHDKEQLLLTHITDKEMGKYLPLLNDLLVLKFPQTSLTVHMDHKERRRNLHKLLFSIVHQEALTQPCVFTVDDAQWMDHDSWGFIMDLARDPSAVLILSTRPIKEDERTPIMNNIWDHPNTIILNIEGLSSEETVSFVCQLLQVDEIDQKVIDIICTRSHGIPLWCEELIETMIEMNVLELHEEDTIQQMSSFYSSLRRGGVGGSEEDMVKIIKKRKCVINESVGISSIPIPESVTGVVLTRIDKMTPSEQMTLKCASVLGKTFDRHILQAILPNKNPKVFQESLNSLAEHGFIECSSISETSLENHEELCSSTTHSRHNLDKCRQLQFIHAYVQETASNLWTESQCRSLHEGAALYLESMAHKCTNCGGGNFMPKAKRSSTRKIGSNVRVTRPSATTRRAFIGSVSIRNRQYRASNSSRNYYSRPNLRRSTCTSTVSTSQRSSSNASRNTFFDINRLLQRSSSESPFDAICPPGDIALDFQDCHCDDVLASVYPQLVYHWKLAGNMIKTLHYLIETAIVSLTTYNNMEAISLLEEAQDILVNHKIGLNEFGKLRQAKLQSLFGQAYYQSGEVNESLPYFQKALSILNCHIPTGIVKVFGSFIWQAQRQYLHVKFPQRYIGIKEGEESEWFLERSRNMSHIAHVYHLQHKNLSTFMTALHQLNTAEEAKEDIHELMEAYATIIECCQLYNYQSLGEIYYKKALALCLSIRYEVDELPTCARLLNVALNLKLCQGKLDTALEIGSAVTRITSTVHHVPMKLAALPFLFYANLLKLKREECEDSLRQLAEVVMESSDLRAQALLDCCQFDALLEIGLRMEREGMMLEQSAERCCGEDFYHFDNIERFFLVTCLALLHSRNGNVLAKKFAAISKALLPSKFETYFSVRGLAKYVECFLDLLSENSTDNELINETKRALKIFKKQLDRYPVFKSQYFRLKGHFHFILQNRSKSERLFRKALHEGEILASLLDCQRVQEHFKCFS